MDAIHGSFDVRVLVLVPMEGFSNECTMTVLSRDFEMLPLLKYRTFNFHT
jgi:hypothetical protein